jgi:glycosyltransferase involved in cell wall biosynthesis
MKIIHIVPQSRSQFFPRTWKQISTTDELLKTNSKYEMEYWCIETKLHGIESGENYGLVYKSFPSFRIGLKRYTILEHSRALIQELREYAQKEEILIHLHGVHCFFSLSIAHTFRNTPIVGAHYGDPPYTYLFYKSKNLIHKAYAVPWFLIEPAYLKGTDVIFAASQQEYNILSQFHPNVELFHSIGVDFEKFKPIPKTQARAMLNIAPDQKVVIFVGRLRSNKGVDITLDAFEKLKSKYNVQLYLIGAVEGDTLLKKAAHSGAHVVGRIPGEQLIPYYCAADVYSLPIFDRDIQPFKGFGIAPIECLACGTPIVGTNLSLFMGNKDELKALGKIPKNPADVANCISSILDNPTAYTNCREVAKKYYDWDVIVKRILTVYEQLELKYYGQSSKK